MKHKNLDPFHDPLSLGNLAISKGYATPEDVRQAVEKQEQRTPLGKILVESGVLSQIQLEELLQEQQFLRAKNKNHVTKMILEHQRGRIKDVVLAFKDLTVATKKFTREF